jgi:hypothetical protein
VQAISTRQQLVLIGLGYAATGGISAALLYERHLQYLANDPAYTSSAMWGVGDTLLALFVFGLLMVPSLFLLRLAGRLERVCSLYARLVFAVSTTAPVCLAALCILFPRSQNAVHEFCVARILIAAPLVVVVMAASRLFARYAAAKRLMSRALLIEGATFAISIALLLAG